MSKSKRQKRKSEPISSEKKQKRLMKTTSKSNKKIARSTKFFHHLISELFLLLEVKRFHSFSDYSLAIPDPWYQDVQELLFLYKKLKLIFGKKFARHPFLDLIVVALVITYYQRYFDNIICRAAREILLRSRRLCSEEGFASFYRSIRDPIDDILGAKGEFLFYFK